MEQLSGAPLNFFPVQLLGDDPFEAYKVAIEKYIAVADKDKQRGAAELLAGMLSGDYLFLSHNDTYDLRDFPSFQALVRRETNEDMELVYTEHKQNIQTEHQDRYAACLDVFPRG